MSLLMALTARLLHRRESVRLQYYFPRPDRRVSMPACDPTRTLAVASLIPWAEAGREKFTGPRMPCYGAHLTGTTVMNFPYFGATWMTGIGVTAFIFWATSGQNWIVRVPLRTLALAVSFTPTIMAVGHGAGPAPAIVVFVLGFTPRYRGVSMQGALPIAIVWAVLLIIWGVWMYNRLGTQ